MPTLQRIVLGGTALAVAVAGRGEPEGRAPSAGSPTPIPAVSPAHGTPETQGKVPPGTRTEPGADKFWRAIVLLKSKRPSDLAAGRAALQAAADQDYTHAQVLLGDCLAAGSYGFAKDARKGVNFFQLAADRGNGFAMVSLGQSLLTGTGARKDLGKATEWLTAALKPEADFSRPVPPADVAAAEAAADAEGGEGVAGEMARDPAEVARATAHYLLGVICVQNSQPAGAQAHFVAAAESGPGARDGLFPAALLAAFNYAFGKGVPRDLARATAMLDLSRKLTARAGVSMIHNYVSLKVVDDFAAADLEEMMDKAMQNGETAIEVRIAETFADKKSKDYNVAEAAKWYELAADNGQAWAMLALAFIYSHGELGHPDPGKAFQWFEKAGGGDKPKHYLAAANLGICYEQGLGTPKNPEKAAGIFKKFGDQEFLCHLGRLGQAPATPQTYAESMKILEAWAKKKDPDAQYFMGRRSLGGWDVPRNIDDATRWFKKAGDAMHGAAFFELGLIHEYAWITLDGGSYGKGRQSAAECFRKGSELGNPDAMVNYATMLFEGSGVPRDIAKAESWDLRCLEISPDHAHGRNNLGVIYESKLVESLRTGDHTAADQYRQKMLDQYERAVTLKNGFAARNLGTLYYEGKLVGRDYRRAYGYLEQATEWGLPGLHLKLAQMHELGQGVPVTYVEAAYHYRLAALGGNTEALRHLVDIYVYGRGMPQDLDRAIHWLSLLAQRWNDPKVSRELGDLLLQNGNYEQARDLFLKLSETNNVVYRGAAFQRLSLIYGRGLGVPKDPAKAQKYLDKALRDGDFTAAVDQALQLLAQGKTDDAIAKLNFVAANGFPRAKYELGRIYLHGSGPTRNPALAVQYFKEAAAKEYPGAQVELATLTLENFPGAPDLDAAIKMAADAAASGDPGARALKEKLEQRLGTAGTPDQIDAAAKTTSRPTGDANPEPASPKDPAPDRK